MLNIHTDATLGELVHKDDVWLKHWASPGVSTPWWLFVVRLGFWLLIGAGVQAASAGEGWHPDGLAAALGIAEVGWRAIGKLRARRRAGSRAYMS